MLLNILKLSPLHFRKVSPHTSFYFYTDLSLLWQNILAEYFKCIVPHCWLYIYLRYVSPAPPYAPLVSLNRFNCKTPSSKHLFKLEDLAVLFLRTTRNVSGTFTRFPLTLIPTRKTRCLSFPRMHPNHSKPITY